jgi:hypothetical protein
MLALVTLYANAALAVPTIVISSSTLGMFPDKIWKVTVEVVPLPLSLITLPCVGPVSVGQEPKRY